MGGKVHLPFSGKTGKGHFSAPVGYGFENYYTKDERDALGVEAARILDEKAVALKKVHSTDRSCSWLLF